MTDKQRIAELEREVGRLKERERQLINKSTIYSCTAAAPIALPVGFSGLHIQ